MAEILDLMARAIAADTRLIAAVRADQLDDPTPCDPWTVKLLVTHLVGVNLVYTAAVTGQDATPEARNSASDDPLGAFAGTAEATLAAWRRPGVLDRTITIPVGAMPASVAANFYLTDLVLHGWDIAKASGQDTDIDPVLVTALMTSTYGNISDNFRGEDGPFGPAVPVADDASDQIRLLAYAGRVT